MTKYKIACIFNYAPHYRHSIYHLMAKELHCDFYFGANLPNGEALKKMDLSTLPGFKGEYRVVGKKLIWQSGKWNLYAAKLPVQAVLTVLSPNGNEQWLAKGKHTVE